MAVVAEGGGTPSLNGVAIQPLIVAPSAVAAACAAAGFRGEALTIAVAIAGAESGYDSHSIGDRNLKEAGEMSVGCFQVNYRPSRDRNTSYRQPENNLDLSNNARAAYIISGGGRSFRPWSTYTNGAYKAFLYAAGRAARGESTGVIDGPGAAVLQMPSVPVLTNVPGPVGAVVPLRIGGALAAGELGNAVIGGAVDLTTQLVSELTVVLEDPGFEMTNRFHLNVGVPVDYSGLRWQCVSFDLDQGPADPHVTLLAHPVAAVRLRTGVPTAATAISPTGYMQALAKAAGLGFVGEPSGVRASIGPAKVRENKAGLTIERLQTAWEVGADWAGQLGFYAFESAGVYYFGSPTYLVGKGRRVQLSYRGSGYPGYDGPTVPMLRVPRASVSKRSYQPAGSVVPGIDGHTTTYLGTMDSLDDVKVTAAIEREPGMTLRPAMSAAVAGIGPWQGLGRLITRVSWSLADLTSEVTIEAVVAEDIPASARTVQDDLATASASSTDTGGPATRGSRSALDFVTYALRQVGDHYVWGAKPADSNPDPDAFDCSGLVSWACGQVGVHVPDGSSNQRAFVVPISVAEAKRTRGALLFHPGHVVISLGDGHHTVEAMGRKYGVVKGALDGRVWTSAGKIPGMVYG